MKVLFFSDTYLPNRDGVVSAMQGLAQEYARRGIETFIFSSGSRKDRKSNTDRRVRYFTSVPFLPYPQYKVALFPHGALAPAKKIRPDVIHSHALATMALGAAYCAQSMGVPSVATFHTKVTDATHYVSKNKLVSGALQEFGWAYFRWLLGRFDIVTAPSIETCKELESHGIKCVAAPNGVDTKRFSPAGAKASLGLDSGKAVKVLFVGRIVKEKNIGFLFEVAKRMEKNRQEALFVIAGKGPALGYFMEKAKAEGLAGRFMFKGFVGDSDLPALYRSCDCFAQPSKFETQGLSVLEAMACGKPAIVVKGFATEECIEQGKNGFALAEDPKLWAKAIMSCAKGKKKMAKSARATACAHSLEKAASEMIAIYRSAQKIHKLKAK